MRRILSIIVSTLMALSVNAQVINVYKNDALVQSYVNTSTTTYDVDMSKLTLNITGSSTISGENPITLTVGSTSPTTNITIPTVTWSSSNTSIATVNASTGVVTGVNDGTTTITATASDGSGATGTYSVTVTNLINGHEYVYIGGKKWATKNHGATSVASDTGAYGDLTTNGNKKCDWGGTWRFPTQSEYTALTKDCLSGSADNGANLSGKLGGNNVSVSITTGGVYWIYAGSKVDGVTYSVAGALFVQISNPSTRLFFPANGWGSSSGQGHSLSNWSQTAYSNGATYALWIDINDGDWVHCKGYPVNDKYCGARFVSN